MLSKLIKSCILAVALFTAAHAAARDKSDDWLEVRSPHFVVASNAGEKQARRVADQFERIRSVFHTAFPKMRVDPSVPIVVLAVKDEKSFKALVPENWLEKGQLRRTGMFLSGPEKNYVLLRLNVEGDNPYHVVFHEYTHLLLHQSVQSLPLWLDEGLAEFYGNSEIVGKEVGLGRPSAPHVILLREKSLLPLDTLFAVDHSSPYYNEENKGSIFYAESWALTHYLVVKDNQERKTQLADFLTSLGQNPDVNTAATRAFGDLTKLQRALEGYVRQSSFAYFRMKASTEVDEDSFTGRELSPADSAALQADFLVHVQRYSDARALLEEALRQDANNAQGQESMGFLEFRQGHRDEAKKWFTQAVKLNSKSYLAHYYYAAMTLQGGAPDAETSQQIENSLKSAIQINPTFAPAYNTLATFYGMKGEKLEDAHMFALQAAQLEPGNVHYLLTNANLMLRMQRPDDAVRICERALSMAKSVEESAAVQSLLDRARQYQDYMAARKNAEEQAQALQSERPATAEQPGPPSGESVRSEEVAPPVLRHREKPLRGQRRTIDGTIREVKCSPPSALDLALDAGNHTLRLHADDYFKVVYTARKFKPTGELLPCTQLKGIKGRIVFFEYQGQPDAGDLVSVEMSK